MMTILNTYLHCLSSDIDENFQTSDRLMKSYLFALPLFSLL
jgi:hypothetical protein